MNDSESPPATGRAGSRPRGLFGVEPRGSLPRPGLGLLVVLLGCAHGSAPPPTEPVFSVSIDVVDSASGLLALEIENRSNRALHFSDPQRWNYVNLVKVGFRAYQPVIPIEAPRTISDRPPDRDGDMVRVHWVLPLEGRQEIAARSSERRMVRVPEPLGGGRYSLALVVVARAKGRWLTVEEPVLGPRTAGLPGPVRSLALVVFGCLLLAGGALLSLVLPRSRGPGR